MLTVRLCYENDRFTPEPKYDAAGEAKLWWLEFDGGHANQAVKDWMAQPRELMTATAIEDEVVALGELLGIKDSTSQKEWKAHGITVKAPRIVGFVNWPDPGISR